MSAPNVTYFLECIIGLLNAAIEDGVEGFVVSNAVEGMTAREVADALNKINPRPEILIRPVIVDNQDLFVCTKAFNDNPENKDAIKTLCG